MEEITWLHATLWKGATARRGSPPSHLLLGLGQSCSSQRKRAGRFLPRHSDLRVIAVALLPQTSDFPIAGILRAGKPGTLNYRIARHRIASRFTRLHVVDVEQR